ncbi:MAG: cobalamin biosynthesis protein CobW [Pseudanabaenaceae cyanobacterium bins.68]|nr:cobalamin biosynthesis protein CobW [Pseudanabaenaceae cyanobacterium bins.68]
MHRIPVTVITGFLGSGKTTLIRSQLQNNQGRRIAVLVNEFGEIGIDGELLRSCRVCDQEGNEIVPNIVELNNGCLCCTVQEDFLPTMQELIKRRDQLDCILIETSGLALPKPLVQAFRWQEIRAAATVDSVVTVVDGRAIASGKLIGNLADLERQRQADPSLSHETELEELLEEQLACADLVLLNKVDLLTDQDIQQVTSWLETQVRSGVKILPCQDGEVDSEVLLGFNAAVEDDLAARPSHHDGEHEHDDQINSVPIVTEQGFEPDELLLQVRSLLENYKIYRVKGFVSVPGKSMRLVFQGVGDRLASFYDRLWRLDEPKLTRLVFIGEGLERQQIMAGLGL